MRKFYALFLFVLMGFGVVAQVSGDYRTADGSFGFWTDAIWDKHNGSTWVSGFSGPLTIGAANTVTLLNGAGVQVVSASIVNNGSIIVNSGGGLYHSGGTITNNNLFTNNGVFESYSGSFIHNQNGGALPASAVFAEGSTLVFSDVTSTMPSNFPTDVGSITINCSSLSSPFLLSEGLVVADNLIVSNSGSSYVEIVNGVGDFVQVNDNLIVSSGEKLIVSTGGAINVDGVVTTSNAADLVIYSTSSGTGSLLSNSSPNGTLKSYVSAGDWHLIGPPNDALNASPTFLTGYMQTYDETTNTWTVQEGNPALSNGYGAAYYFHSDFTASMTGSLNGSSKTISELANTGGVNNGYHLLANPFPCSIDLDNCTFSGSMSTSYQVYNGSSYVVPSGNLIGASQGFFVQVNIGASSQSVIFETAAKSFHNTSLLKEVETDVVMLSLSDASGNSEDQLIVRFDEEATTAYDHLYDGHKIIGNPIAGEIMAQISVDELACVLGLPISEEPMTVTVDFKKGEETNYILALDNNTLVNLEMTLEDTDTGESVVLQEGDSYSFSSVVSTQGRFLLHFQKSTSLIEEHVNESFSVWNVGAKLYVEQGKPQDNTTLLIFDISGKLVYRSVISSEKINIVNFEAPKGTYIVNLVSKDRNLSKKIIK